MNRQLASVHQIWTEYKRGLDGGPAVRELEALYGRSWRKSNTETKFFCRRLPVYAAIERLAREGMPEDQAVDILDALRVARRLTVPAFQSYIKALLDETVDSLSSVVMQ